jgi:mono/diheme cytochrome c family protein
MRRAVWVVVLLVPGCGGDTPNAVPAVLTAEAQLRVEYPDRDVETGDTILTPAEIARGDSIYHGQAAFGTCFTCHGDDARGGPIAPDMTDGQWNRGDGSFGFIRGIIVSGVLDNDPVMPAMGGTSLSEDDQHAVAAYVYWLSRRHQNARARRMAGHGRHSPRRS